MDVLEIDIKTLAKYAKFFYDYLIELGTPQDLAIRMAGDWHAEVLKRADDYCDTRMAKRITRAMINKSGDNG